MPRFAVLALISVLVVMPAIGQRSKRAEIKRIDAYASTLDAFARRNRRSAIVFADVSDYEKEIAEWRKFTTSASLERFREEREVYDIANVWRRNRKVVLAVFTFSSPSGDWAKYVSMYYRPDGSLAKSESELRTFYGDFIVRQQYHFDLRGRLLRRTRDYFDLSTGKPKQPDQGFIVDNSGFIENNNYYPTTKKLPFAHLLKLR
jgi:hypothetical protein